MISREIKKSMVPLVKTINLKTPKIAKEWIRSLKKDILEGPKYLRPLSESI